MKLAQASCLECPSYPGNMKVRTYGSSIAFHEMCIWKHWSFKGSNTKHNQTCSLRTWVWDTTPWSFLGTTMLKALMNTVARTCAWIQPGAFQPYLYKECFSLETDKYCRKPIFYKDCSNTVWGWGLPLKIPRIKMKFQGTIPCPPARWAATTRETWEMGHSEHIKELRRE